MRRVVAPLAAVVLGLAVVGCGGGGAEPGAPTGATLILDFQPNAVHSGLYAAQAEGFFKDEGLDLAIHEPSSTADSAKLLEAGRADFAIMDINDFGIARERGADLVAIAAIVQRPLASVIAGNRNAIRTPADLAGKTVGVTGVPSDDAVLDTVLRSGGVDPSSVKRVTIGFNAVADLAAGKVDAATGFWNAEGIELQQMGIPIREFRVDQFGAPRYPELVLVTRRETVGQKPIGDGSESFCRMLLGLNRGYEVLASDPKQALGDLLASNEGLDASAQQKQFDALAASDAWSVNDRGTAPTTALAGGQLQWLNWSVHHGLFSPGDERQVETGFYSDLGLACKIAKNQAGK
jgi:putative hydroxymethylpyrimidine transport system substrate-binding protein